MGRNRSSKSRSFRQSQVNSDLNRSVVPAVPKNRLSYLLDARDNIGRRRSDSNRTRLALPRSNLPTRQAVGPSTFNRYRSQTRPSLQPAPVVGARLTSLVKRENFRASLVSPSVCEIRKVRKQVMHAKGYAGSFHRMPKFRLKSLIKCK